MAAQRSRVGERTALARFFEANSTVALSALALLDSMRGAGEIAIDTIQTFDFDACIGYILPLPADEQTQLSYRLRLCREAVHCFNKHIALPRALQTSLRRHVGSFVTPSLTRRNYARAVSRHRSLAGNLRRSYVRSRVRVYYREQLVATAEGMRANPTVRCINALSAFLLFDDDIVDLTTDLAEGKSTILVEFLRSGGRLDAAISSMQNLLGSSCRNAIPSMLRSFVDALSDTYASAMIDC